MVLGLRRPPLPMAHLLLTLLLSPARGPSQQWPDGPHPLRLRHTRDHLSAKPVSGTHVTTTLPSLFQNTVNN